MPDNVTLPEPTFVTEPLPVMLPENSLLLFSPKVNAVAAVLAMGLLGEHLSPAQWLAIACIVAASMGSALTAGRPVGETAGASKRLASGA